MTAMVDHAALKAALHYDPETGIFTRLQLIRGQGQIGERAGCRTKGDYERINFMGVKYPGHRLAWFYMTGEWPIGVDHENRNKHDNRWNNLRLADQSDNGGNHTIHKNNTSGYKGVSWSKQHKKWIAQICRRRKRYFVGFGATPAEAHALYLKAAAAHFGEFARAA